MDQSSNSTHEKARKAHAKVLQAMQEPGKGGAMAVVLGVSDSTVSRIKSEHLESALALIYALGFKCVPADFKCIDAETYAFLTAKHQHVMKVAPQLIWETEE